MSLPASCRPDIERESGGHRNRWPPVAGRPHLEPVVRDDTPAPPTEAEAAAVVEYFASHEVAAEDIPTLEILVTDE